MAPVLKTGVPERVSGVRIPPLPPYSLKFSVLPVPVGANAVSPPGSQMPCVEEVTRRIVEGRCWPAFLLAFSRSEDASDLGPFGPHEIVRLGRFRVWPQTRRKILRQANQIVRAQQLAIISKRLGNPKMRRLAQNSGVKRSNAQRIYAAQD